MKTITLLLKFLSVVTGLAAYANMIPEKYAGVAVLVFAIASTLKDLCAKIGDWMDDGKINGSFPVALPLLLGGLTVTLFTGCATAEKYLLTPTAATITAAQPAQPATTNTATGEVIPAQPAQPAQTNVTAYAPAPAVTSILQTGQQFAPLAPAPWGWIASGLLALISAGLGLFAKSKSGQLSDTQSITRAVVAGVEAANNAEIKAAVQNAAVAAGVQSKLDPIVQSVSAAMK